MSFMKKVRSSFVVAHRQAFKNAWMKKRKPARGMAMFSEMAWWAYMIILIVVVLAMFGAIMVMGKSGAEASNLTQLATATMNVGRTNAGYGTSTLNTVIYNAGLLPSSYTYEGGTIYNQWNGEVNITGATSYFSITDETIPTSECISIARSLAAGGVAGYLDIGGTQITSASDASDIDAACGSSNSSVNGTTTTITMYVGTTTGS